jgi:predicted metalloprotease
MELQATASPASGATACSSRRVGSGDLEEALNAATAIGDDRLQQQSQGRWCRTVHPRYLEQRYTWFKRGFDSGDPAQCNTFGGAL